MVSLGTLGLPTGKSTTCPYSIGRLYWIDKCEQSNCTIVTLLENGVQ